MQAFARNDMWWRRSIIWKERHWIAKKSKLEIEREKLAKMQDDTASQAAKIKALEAEERASLLGKSVLPKASFEELSELVSRIETLGLAEALKRLR